MALSCCKFNSTGDRGGGIHVSQSCEIQFTDGLISDNRANAGGGVSIRSESTADMTGVEILGKAYPIPPAGPPAALAEETVGSLKIGGLSGAFASLQAFSEPVETSPPVIPEPTIVVPPATRLDAAQHMEDSPKAAAHDAVLENVTDREPLASSASLSNLAWMFDYEQMIAQNRPLAKHDRAEATVDKLLATWP